ncbi:MAG: hypothetical protein QOC68_2286 [Solirubrobacteraceae bacterium]|nr:hypothetical protein [Solirubrobacteraceae bacterium]
MPRSASKIGVALAVLALVVVLLAGLLRSRPHYAGSNAVRALQLVAPLRANTPVCQKGELVPFKASTVEVSVSTAGQPGPPLTAELRRGGRVLARGSRRGGYKDGLVAIPIPVVRKTLVGVDVCLRATASPPAQLYGQLNGQGKLVIGRKTVPGVFRIAYMRPGRESWLALAPTIAHRFAQAKTRVATPFTFWLLLVAVVGVAGLAVRAAVSDDEDEAVA